jgi:hypothetical protein
MSQQIVAPASCRQESQQSRSQREAIVTKFVPALTANQNVGAPTLSNWNCRAGVSA